MQTEARPWDAVSQAARWNGRRRAWKRFHAQRSSGVASTAASASRRRCRAGGSVQLRRRVRENANEDRGGGGRPRRDTRRTGAAAAAGHDCLGEWMDWAATASMRATSKDCFGSRLTSSSCGLTRSDFDCWPLGSSLTRRCRASTATSTESGFDTRIHSDTDSDTAHH